MTEKELIAIAKYTMQQTAAKFGSKVSEEDMADLLTPETLWYHKQLAALVVEKTLQETERELAKGLLSQLSKIQRIFRRLRGTALKV